ncbi:MAG: TIR domain-containing protein [Candidatus Microthrix subdominans]
MICPFFVSYVSGDEQSRQDLNRLASSLRVEFLDLAHREVQDWKDEYRRILGKVCALVVLVGHETYRSGPVRWEIAQARSRGVPILGLRVSDTAAALPDGIVETEVVRLESSEARKRLISLGCVKQHNYLTEVAASIRDELSTSDLPDGPVDDLLASYAVLLLAKGTEVTNEDVHNAWAAWMLRVDPTHPAILPFELLDADAAAQDAPFVDAIRSVAATRQGSEDD